MIGLIASAFHLFGGGGWFWHPLAEGHGSTCSAIDHSGCGYAFWSGFGSDLAEITLVSAVAAMLLTFWRKHNCHVHRCPWISWHPHPEHGHPVCRKHHPDGQGRAAHLLAECHSLEAHARIIAERIEAEKPRRRTRKPPADPSNRST